MLCYTLDAADSLRHRVRLSQWVLCRRYKTYYLAPSLSSLFLKKTRAATTRPLDWNTPAWIAMAKRSQVLVVLSKVLPANVPSAIAIAVGSLINTTHTDVLGINTDNSLCGCHRDRGGLVFLCRFYALQRCYIVSAPTQNWERPGNCLLYLSCSTQGW